MSDGEGREVVIPGLSGRWWEITERYDYDADKCRCPHCGGLGCPWGGWFTCGDCSCKAVIETGQAFIAGHAMVDEEVLAELERCTKDVNCVWPHEVVARTRHRKEEVDASLARLVAADKVRLAFGGA